MQPNYGAEPAEDAASLDSFARDANVFLRQLRAAYFDRLQAGDDPGVYATTRQARVVEHAVCVHASARSLSAIRSRSAAAGGADGGEVAAQKAYLRGVQTRLEEALARRDVPALHQVCVAADAAMEQLAHSDAFGDLTPRVDVARELESRAVDVDRELAAKGTGAADAGTGAATDSQFLRSMESRADAAFAEPSEAKRRGFAGFSFSRLSRKDKVVLVVYVLMLICAALAVVFITIEYIDGMRNPESFIRLNPQTQLAMPVITVCLSRAGVPLSRLQLFNFTDAQGRHFIGSRPERGPSPLFETAIDRYFYNPNNEDCVGKLGDFFPFPVEKLNALANGTMTTACQPCFRFGHKLAASTNSTKFERSSFASIWTDNYALECFKNPGGLTTQSEEFLWDFMFDKVRANKTNPHPIGKVLREGILVKDGQTNATFTKKELKRLKSRELCNIFYFGVFPKLLDKRERNKTQVRYVLRNNEWVFDGTGPEFIPPPEKKKHKKNTDFFPLEAVRVFVSRNATDINNVQDNVLIGPNTQSYISLTSVKDSNGLQRYDMSTSTSNFVDSEVVPQFGYWFNYRLFYNFGRLIEEEYYSGSPYTFLQWLIDFTGYLSLFTGASVFSVVLVPILVAMRNKDRRTLRKENPEAYLLRKYRRNFGVKRSLDTEEYSAGSARGEEGRSVKLPGYTV